MGGQIFEPSFLSPWSYFSPWWKCWHSCLLRRKALSQGDSRPSKVYFGETEGVHKRPSVEIMCDSSATSTAKSCWKATFHVCTTKHCHQGPVACPLFPYSQLSSSAAAFSCLSSLLGFIPSTPTATPSPNFIMSHTARHRFSTRRSAFLLLYMTIPRVMSAYGHHVPH